MSEEEKNGEFEISNSFGKIRASGRVVVLALMLLVSSVVLAGIIHTEHQTQDKAMKEAAAQQAEQLRVAAEQRGKQLELLASQQKQLMENMETMIWVLVQTPEGRSKIKLDMPQSLRSRLISQERAR